ncbi:hypothetical protein QOT17_023067 [Balamuthia mandrillaris]
MTLQPLPLLVVALAFVQGLFSVGTVCTDQSLNASVHDHKDPGELPVVTPSAVVVAAALVIIAVGPLSSSCPSSLSRSPSVVTSYPPPKNFFGCSSWGSPE